MASANVELVRSIVAAWERGDYSSTGWADPEIEFVLPDGPDPGSWRGLASMAEAWRGRMSVWEKLAGHLEECRALDNERVLLLFHWTGRGNTSGIELADVHAQGASLFHVRDGKVTRFVHYWDRERSLADLGLSPETDSSAA